MLLATATACTGQHRAAAPAPSVTCLPYREPRTLADIESTVAGYRDVPPFRGGDVGADAQLQYGRRVWVFGDTLRGSGYGSSMMVRDSTLVFGPDCVTAVIPPGKGAVAPDRPDGVGRRPMSLLVRRKDGYDRLLVFYQRVRGLEQGVTFATPGPALAEFRVPRGGLPVLQRLTDLGPAAAGRRPRTAPRVDRSHPSSTRQRSHCPRWRRTTGR